MQEQFSYSLMASALGILIVFTILVLLSGLMILIRKLSDDRPEKKVKSAPAQTFSKSTELSTSQNALPLPVLVAAAAEGMSTVYTGTDWLIAAVAAYFASEDDNASGPSAAAWTSTYIKYDPWVANNKLSKIVPGV